MKTHYVFIILLTLVSCSKDNDEKTNNLAVTVINDSGIKIDSVKFYTETYNSELCDSVLFTDIDTDANVSTEWNDIQTCDASGQFLITAYLRDTVLTTHVSEFTDGNIEDFLIAVHVYYSRLLPFYGRTGKL